MTEEVCRKWFLHTKKADFTELGKRLGIDPVIVRILRNRGLETYEQMKDFLTQDRTGMHPAVLLPALTEAAHCICEKIRSGCRIRIAGDYDIDGVCATFILYDGLKKAGAAVDYVIPERVRDGYGLNARIIDEAAADGIDTLITCDNGISAMEELAAAKRKGITVILTDHHDIRRDENGKEILPEADYIVSAKLDSSEYPEKEICGAVTAWKLLYGVFAEMGIPEESWLGYLEFAGIATVGDVMKLVGENRVIAREALLSMNRKIVNPGLKELVRACGIDGKKICCYHIGFVIGPCINAGGRLETAEKAMRLFTAEQTADAALCAKELKELNDSRKGLTAEGVEEAAAQVRQKFMQDRVLVVYLPELHESMAGIVAGRIREAFGRPAFVMTDAAAENENGKKLLKGSGRSVESWNMFEGLQKVSGLMEKYGGHPMAAGLSLYADRLEEFRKQLNAECGLNDDDLVEKVWIDMRLPLGYVSRELVRQLDMLEPFGNGNEKPLFAEKNVRISGLRILGKNKNALRMDVFSEDGCRMQAVMFGDAGKLYEELFRRDRADIVYYPVINEYQGMETLQIRIADFR